MNRAFFAGTLKKKPEIMYTPQGERIVKFSLWVEEGSFPVEIMYIDSHTGRDYNAMVGNEVMVAGSLAKKTGKEGITFILKAHIILWMEE